MSEKNKLSINSVLQKTVLKDFKEKTIDMANQMIKEYQCNTILEKSLCEIIANSYGRILSTSQLINDELSLNYPSKEKTQYLIILSKELDIQNRTYLTAINAFMDIKNPQMTINLNSENTFLGKNQQFNNNSQKDENIKG